MANSNKNKLNKANHNHQSSSQLYGRQNVQPQPMHPNQQYKQPFSNINMSRHSNTPMTSFHQQGPVNSNNGNLSQHNSNKNSRTRLNQTVKLVGGYKHNNDDSRGAFQYGTDESMSRHLESSEKTNKHASSSGYINGKHTKNGSYMQQTTGGRHVSSFNREMDENDLDRLFESKQQRRGKSNFHEELSWVEQELEHGSYQKSRNPNHNGISKPVKTFKGRHSQ